MKPAPFEYCRADTLDEALDLLAEFGPDGAVLAGGMSLGPMLNFRMVRPGAVIDVNRIDSLGGVAREDGWLETGALCRQVDAMNSDEIIQAVPLLARALPNVGHFQTRNRGTLGGSVAHADPSAEIPLCLVTLGGEVTLASKARRRRVPAEAFFDGILATTREPDELLTGLCWPVSREGAGYGFEEIAQRHGDFAITAAAAMTELDQGGLVRTLALGLGGGEDRPIKVDIDQFIGASPNADTARAIAELAAEAVEPIEDNQANAAYRRQLVRVLGARSLERAFADAQGDC